MQLHSAMEKIKQTTKERDDLEKMKEKLERTQEKSEESIQRLKQQV